MSGDLPPPFFSDPVRGRLALAADDHAFVGPDELTRHVALRTLVRNDGALVDLLGRAWRSGAPDQLVGSIIGNYGVAHDLGIEEMATIRDAAHLVVLDDSVPDQRLALAAAVREEIDEAVENCLVALQDDLEPCSCPACIAVAAALN